MADEKRITFTHNGKQFSLSEEEIEAAYRYQKREYLKEDVAGRYSESYDIDTSQLDDGTIDYIADKAENIESKSDGFWDYYWANIDEAIAMYEEEINNGKSQFGGCYDNL